MEACADSSDSTVKPGEVFGGRVSSSISDIVEGLTAGCGGTLGSNLIGILANSLGRMISISETELFDVPSAQYSSWFLRCLAEDDDDSSLVLTSDSGSSCWPIVSGC